LYNELTNKIHTNCRAKVSQKIFRMNNFQKRKIEKVSSFSVDRTTLAMGFTLQKVLYLICRKQVAKSFPLYLLKLRKMPNCLKNATKEINRRYFIKRY
ncbi:hypothetical protein, partial [Porphyromonas gingivalis]|uniref:hypothetical protein n=1 Tax=Porphyromonas gingivalis TaxID=837 RepID=UPI001C529718